MEPELQFDAAPSSALAALAQNLILFVSVLRNQTIFDWIWIRLLKTSES
jgi:hypothetical protein